MRYVWQEIKNRVRSFSPCFDVPNQSKVDKLLKNGSLKAEDKERYKRITAAVSQRTIQIVGDNWSSFAAAKSDWKKSPEKYKAAPRPPKYVKSAKTLYIPCSTF